MKRITKPRRTIKFLLFFAVVAVIGYALQTQAPNFASIAYPPIPKSHYKLIEDAVDFCKLPRSKRGFIAAVAYAESTFHADSQSGAGAVGVMQLLRGTGFGVAQKYQIAGLNASTFTDPAISYKMGTCYIHYLMTEETVAKVVDYDPKHWDNEEMLMAIMVGYNSGPANGREFLRTCLASSCPAPAGGPVSYAHKIRKATSVYNLDFARWDQEQASGEAEPPDLREFIWKIITGN